MIEMLVDKTRRTRKKTNKQDGGSRKKEKKETLFNQFFVLFLSTKTKK